MRILQIIPSIALIYGGPSQMILGLSAALARQGIEVTILTTNANGDAGQPPLDVPLNQPIEQDGYTIRYFRCFPFRRYKFSFGLLQWFANHTQEFDLAHFHALFSPVISLAALIARNQNLPYILRPLGTLDPADLQKKKTLKKIYTFLVEKANISQAAALHFTTQQEAKISERFNLTTKDLIIPLGTNSLSFSHSNSDQVRHKFGISEETPCLLFLSRIEPKKGLDLLIPALEILVAQGLDFHFILAGSNPQDPDYERKIQTKIAASSLAKRITLTGFVTGELKASLLQTADLFVLPSYYENFGIAVAEAMAAGTPVMISQGVYIWEDIIQAEAGWVSTMKVNEIADLLRLILQNSQERKRRGLNAQEYASKHYQWDAIAQKMIQAYSEILQTKNR